MKGEVEWKKRATIYVFFKGGKTLIERVTYSSGHVLKNSISEHIQRQQIQWKVFVIKRGERNMGEISRRTINMKTKSEEGRTRYILRSL